MYNTNVNDNKKGDETVSIYDLTKKLSTKGHFGERIAAELTFASQYNEHFHCGKEQKIAKIAQSLAEKECITSLDIDAAEKEFSDLSEKIKNLTVIAVAHAHIDMNWMWRYDETVSSTLATFRTILDFMKEYPTFTFGQSQASVYKIVEQYDPDMLEEIRQYVKEGRWQPVVTSWVETDKNMPNGENLARHILYSKQYISSLLGVDKDSLDIDFEPDTFGHNANVPEILAAGNVKYYYHCRGYQGHNIYRWKSSEASKKEVLVYREPVWYNAEITYDDFSYMPKFAKDNNISTLLKVYGVGDHGGGPTRRDLERLLDMMNWPLLPTIKFGTYKQFFDYLETKRSSLPVVCGELNSFAEGCYTTQTRIKRMNKICENQLFEAEFFNVASQIHGGYKYDTKCFGEAWQNVLFNTFHDILPGSGTIDTREYALGKYQECLATTSARKNLALTSIANMIDTSAIDATTDAQSVSEGAGVGYNVPSGNYDGVGRNSGFTRIFTLFNSCAYKSTAPATITVWDYPVNVKDTFVTCNSKTVTMQLLDENPMFYWGHLYQRIIVDVPIEPFGYTTVVLHHKESAFEYPFPTYPRLDQKDVDFVLENQHIRARFDVKDCSLVELVDKKNGKSLIDKKTAFFRLITEDASKEMSAWVVGRYSAIADLTQNVITRPHQYVKGELMQSISYEIPFGNSSRLFVTVSLSKNSRLLVYKCSCDFREVSVPHVTVPQLSLFLPLTSSDNTYTAAIPFGEIARTKQNCDMPAVGGVALSTNGGRLCVFSNSKYGFRTTSDGISMTVVRQSYEPDPLPDFGVTEFDFAISPIANDEEWAESATIYAHQPACVAQNAHGGTLPLLGHLLKIEGARVSCVKMSEKDDEVVLRLYNANGKVKIEMPYAIHNAELCDINEDTVSAIKHSGNSVQFDCTDKLVTVKIR